MLLRRCSVKGLVIDIAETIIILYRQEGSDWRDRVAGCSD